MLTAAEEKIIHDKVEALRPIIIAAEMGLRARVSRRTETEEGPSPMIRLIFKTCDDSPLMSHGMVEEISVHDVGGNFQVGDEFDVTFKLRPKSTLAASVKKNGF